MQVLLVAEEDDVGHTVDRHSGDLFARLGCGGDLLHLGAFIKPSWMRSTEKAVAER